MKVLTKPEMLEIAPDGREALKGEYLTECRQVTPLCNPQIGAFPFQMRNWSFVAVFFFWVALAWCVPTWLGISGVLGFLPFWTSLFALLVGSIVLAGLCVLTTFPAVKYGIPFAVICRSAFGTYGARFAAILRAAIAAGWAGVEFFIGAISINGILIIIWPGWANVPLGVVWCYLFFLLLNAAVALLSPPEGGQKVLKWVNYTSVPVALFIVIAVLVWIGTNAGFGPSMALKAEVPPAAGMAVVVLFLSFMIIPVIEWTDAIMGVSDMLRIAKSQRIQTAGQMLAIPIAFLIFIVVGLLSAGASVVVFGELLWNPIDLMTRIGTGWAATALLFLIIITLTTNVGINLIPGGYNISNLYPKKISWTLGVIITIVVANIWMPWRFFEAYGAYVEQWLALMGALIGPLGVILIADYWVVRKRKFYLYDLYQAEGIYKAWRGWNPAGIITIVVSAVVAYVISYNVLNNALLTWFIGAGISFFLYWALARLWVIPKWQAVEPWI